MFINGGRIKKPDINTLEELIVKYLNKNYSMSYGNYLSGVVNDKLTNKHLMPTALINIVDRIFTAGDWMTHKIVKDWWDQKELSYINGEMKGKVYLDDDIRYTK